MFNINALFMTLFLILFALSQAKSSEIKPVIVLLQQAMDTDCKGVIDTPYSADQILSVLPNQCVMYKITVKNRTHKNLGEVSIKGNIPPYTRLEKQSIFAYKESQLPADFTFQILDSAQINVKLTKLASFQTITIFYSVRVN